MQAHFDGFLSPLSGILAPMLILAFLLSFSLHSLHSADLLVSLSSSSKHALWAEKPTGLCDAIVKNGTPPRGALFISCDTTVSKVRFIEPGILDINVDMEPVKVGFTPVEEQRNIHPIYVTARAKISEMEKEDKKFRKELEEEIRILFDDKAFFLSDTMHVVLPAETEFTIYRPDASVAKGTLEQLANN
jgi:hypothetical protein